MKRGLLVIFLIFLLGTPAWAFDVYGDMSNATMTILNGTTFRLHNIAVSAPEINLSAFFWADFQWDPLSWRFVPVSYGEEPASTVTPPAQDITGTYSLKAFTIKFSNGLTLTEKNVSVSGAMYIGPNTISQSIIVNNNPVTLSGTYSITYTSGTTEGLLHITDSSGTHDVSFTISGNDLTTYSGVLPVNSTTTAEEWDTWEKNSDFIQAASAYTKEDRSSESSFKFIGELIIEKGLIAIPEVNSE